MAASVSPIMLCVSSSSSTIRSQQPINRSRCPNFIRPFLSTRTSPTANASLRVSRLGVVAVTPKRVFRVLASSGLEDGDSGTPELGLDDVNNVCAAMNLFSA